MTDERPPDRSGVSLALRETYYYCLFGGPATALLLFFVLILATPLMLLWGSSVYLHTAGRMACFSLILWSCGLPANAIFTVLLRGRLYVPGDPMVDWLPWLPSTRWIVGASDGGRYVLGGSALKLRLWWAAFAVPTWGAALLIYSKWCV